MDQHQKHKKMLFVPIVRRRLSLQSGDDDLLNKEMDEIFRSASESPNRTIPSLKIYQNDLVEENEEAKKLEEICEDSETERPQNEKKAQEETKKTGMKYFPLDFLEGRRKRRNESSQSSFLGSNISINIEGNSLKLDHMPHDLFVQLNELHSSSQNQEWHETARWVKYEENVEEVADRWGQAHISPLSFHSLLNVRRCLETGVVLLDVEEKDFPHIVFRAVKKMFSKGIIRFDDQENIFRTVLTHHDFDAVFSFGLKRGFESNTSIKSHETDGRIIRSMSRKTSLKNFKRRGSSTVYHPGSMNSLAPSREDEKISNSSKLQSKKENELKESQIIQNEYLLERLPLKCEGAAILTGIVDFLEQPTIAFIRLREGMKIPYILEVSIPIKFLFILLGPKWQDINYHEVGRAISTLLNNKDFSSQAYKAKSRIDLMTAMNEFLDESLVIPPGKLEKEDLFPFVEIKEKADMIRMRKRRAYTDEFNSQCQIKLNQDQLKFLSDKFEAGQNPEGPLKKTGLIWGGLVNDVKRRLPMFKSDITDGLNSETFAATIFLYFACFATAITFGGLEGDLTNGNIGISETILSASIVGMIFHLFCGQPLVIVGTTGPLILFDKALFEFCESQKFDFLNVRCYVGFWTIAISLLVSAFEGSTYVKHFSRFTQEIFSALITLIYIYSTYNKTISVYQKNPLMELDDYKSPFNETEPKGNILNQPNTALFCTLLTLGTFTLAYTFKTIKTSKFLGKMTRKILGDFCVPISIGIFVLVANFVSQVETEKLNVPDGIKPTLARKWVVAVWKSDNPIWLPVVCVVPSLLVFILIFIESHISELIVDKSERKLKKGSGFHLDIVLLCFLNAFCGMFGLPWHCAAAVRSVAHVTSVTIMSTNHAPGESPRIVDVKEQRISGFFVSLFIGLSIFAAPLLKKIPMSVLFGVFLYMGVCSMIGVQLFERIILFLVPVKYHPHVPYATKVLTSRMHIYTLIQVVALIVLWVINESSISLSFPFFLILMVPLRKSLDFFYSPSELEALDGVEHNDEEDHSVDNYEVMKKISSKNKSNI